MFHENGELILLCVYYGDVGIMKPIHTNEHLFDYHEQQLDLYTCKIKLFLLLSVLRQLKLLVQLDIL